ncbi:MAG: hypothetical protein OEV91_05925 [Desulfobulbaceae bacterium]|nr:hypothetical protein [Desulfobulbaceae bacterium]
MAAATKTKETGLGISGVEVTTLDRINTGILQVSIGLVVMMSGLAGIWGLATLVSAIAKSGGLAGLARGFMTAVTGQ